MNSVEHKKAQRVRGKITVDSGAGESVWPKDLLKEVKIEESAQSLNGGGFLAANGTRMKNYGKKHIRFDSGDGPEKAMSFQVTDVRKPLAAVSRIVDRGNKGQFGPRPEDNFIENILSKERILMVRDNGTYVIDVDVLINEVEVEEDSVPKTESSVFTRRV